MDSGHVWAGNVGVKSQQANRYLKRKRYIKSKINTFLTIGTSKKNLNREKPYTKKTLYQELLIQRNIVIKKWTAETMRYIEKTLYRTTLYRDITVFVFNV